MIENYTPAGLPPERVADFWRLVDMRADGHWIWRGQTEMTNGCVTQFYYIGAKRRMTPRQLAYQLIHCRACDGRLYRQCDVEACMNPAHMARTKRPAPRPEPRAAPRTHMRWTSLDGRRPRGEENKIQYETVRCARKGCTERTVANHGAESVSLARWEVAEYPGRCYCPDHRKHKPSTRHGVRECHACRQSRPLASFTNMFGRDCLCCETCRARQRETRPAQRGRTRRTAR
jgi:hypothetical protein